MQQSVPGTSQGNHRMHWPGLGGGGPGRAFTARLLAGLVLLDPDS